MSHFIFRFDELPSYIAHLRSCGAAAAAALLLNCVMEVCKLEDQKDLVHGASLYRRRYLMSHHGTACRSASDDTPTHISFAPPDDIAALLYDCPCLSGAAGTGARQGLLHQVGR